MKRSTLIAVVAAALAALAVVGFLSLGGAADHDSESAPAATQAAPAAAPGTAVAAPAMRLHRPPALAAMRALLAEQDGGAAPNAPAAPANAEPAK